MRDAGTAVWAGRNTSVIENLTEILGGSGKRMNKRLEGGK